MFSNRILAVAVAGLVGALSLPSTVHAQSVTPERALLNQPAAASWGTTVAVIQPAVIDGERALLNHHQTITLNPVAPVIADAPSVDGAKALLNRSSS